MFLGGGLVLLDLYVMMDICTVQNYSFMMSIFGDRDCQIVSDVPSSGIQLN
jgi:hypothetical protein